MIAIAVAVDSNEDFVQILGVAASALSPLQFSNVVGAELLTPPSNGFIGNIDSAFGEKVFHIPEAHAEATIDTDGIANDFGREAMTVETRTTDCHPLSPAASPSN